VRRVSRILSIALVTAGLVILADVGLTLLWGEPVSALYASIRQSAAEADLEDLEEKLASDAEPAKLAPMRARRLARGFRRFLEPGKGIGRITIDRTGTDIVFVEGTEPSYLQIGPGRYERTGLPGEGRTVGIAGHRTTYGAPFREIDELRRDDEIVVEMPYGTFTYRVIGHEIVRPEETRVLGDFGRERLVLTACHPLYSAAERYVVSARLESSRR
jgi:sortase A